MKHDDPAPDAATRFLHLLKTRGALSAQDIAAATGMTPMGARQHLLRLEQRGLVRSRSVARSVGRPARLWELTAAAWSQFPDRHEELTLQLIEGVREVFGESGLERLIAKRERETAQRYRAALAGARTLGERLQRLAALRSREGYMASVISEGRGRYLLIEDHCPVCAAARSCQGFCRSELDLFRGCLDAEVERSEYLLEGARRCAYRVRARTGDSARQGSTAPAAD